MPLDYLSQKKKHYKNKLLCVSKPIFGGWGWVNSKGSVGQNRSNVSAVRGSIFCPRNHRKLQTLNSQTTAFSWSIVNPARKSIDISLISLSVVISISHEQVINRGVWLFINHSQMPADWIVVMVSHYNHLVTARGGVSFWMSKYFRKTQQIWAGVGEIMRVRIFWARGMLRAGPNFLATMQFRLF